MPSRLWTSAPQTHAMSTRPCESPSKWLSTLDLIATVVSVILFSYAYSVEFLDGTLEGSPQKKRHLACEVGS
jgi:hypothetical protein